MMTLALGVNVFKQFEITVLTLSTDTSELTTSIKPFHRHRHLPLCASDSAFFLMLCIAMNFTYFLFRLFWHSVGSYFTSADKLADLCFSSG